MVMELAIVCLTPAGSTRGFTEPVDLSEASVGAGAEAAAEADLVGGGRFKVAFNSSGVKRRKDGYYAKR
jgi:hypothetical protein